MKKVIPITRNNHKISMVELCKSFGLTRYAYYKFQKRQVKKHSVELRVVELVKEQRKDQPRVGTRKLYEALDGNFKSHELKIGRDKLFDILRNQNMLVKRKKAYCKTTNSYHHFHKYKNLIKDLHITAPNQVWASDITYIRTAKGFCYLALITDMY